MDIRHRLIRLAHRRPDLRVSILPLLKTAKDFPTEDALKKYLKEHPDADRSKHHVEKADDGGSKGKSEKGDDGGASLKKVPDDATMKDLPKAVHEEIKDYKMDVVGEDAKQAVEIARKVKEGIDKAADICKMSPSVCTGNKGLTRDKMPQIEGEKSVKEMLASKDPEEKAKGEAMVQAGADPKSDKSVLASMLEHFEKNGVKTEIRDMPVGKMKATQSEIKASKVFGMADAHLRGKFDNIDASVVVSKDGHILDGHHRWAALLTIDPSRTMKVKQIDMTMDELLKESASFPGVYQADFQGKPLAEDKQKTYKEKNTSRWKKGSLRHSLIRLAHEHPQMRPHLLPILHPQSDPSWHVSPRTVTASSGSLSVVFDPRESSLDGSVYLPANRAEDISGFVQLKNLPLRFPSGVTVFVGNAGTIVVTEVSGNVPDGAVNGEVVDLNLMVLSASDRRVPVSGEILISGRKVRFQGLFHLTGYLRQGLALGENPETTTDQWV